MKTLIKILCLSSLCIADTLPNDSTIKNLSFDEKKILFNKFKKPVVSNLLINNVVPTLGYARIDNWRRGILCSSIQFGVPVFYYAIRHSINWINKRFILADLELMAEASLIFFGLYILHNVDLFIQTNKYNERLHNKIFDKKDNNFSFLILPTSDGAYLNLSYKF
tara:strand:+ start:252 stop:746 length:495 start_codon:yes stop_codon:yes gene_type:complete